KVLFHWAAPGYLMLFPLLGARVAEQLARGSRVTRVWLIGSAAFICIALAVVATEIRFNWLPAIGIDFPAGSDPDLEAVDWTSLRTELAARHLLGQPGLAIAANNWLDAGKLGYALGDAANVTCLNTDARQFGIENPATRAIGQNVLIVAPRRTAEAIRSQLGSVFDDIEALPPLTLLHAGHSAMQVPLYLGHRLRAWPPSA
ncbi:MAG: glycosyl transferase, partial [Acetobacteraceae bacterium]|nr:glycosyl transferase [Acetobacteraceae bacterium]